MKAGIPTVYRHIQFRSRNEARWAALFDELGWRWEYEPLDAAGYIPDFAILGQRPFLVEVKPDLSMRTLGSHIERIEEALVGVWQHDVLIVGGTPLPYEDSTDGGQYWEHQPAGLLGEYGDWDGKEQWAWDAGLWNLCHDHSTHGARKPMAIFHPLMYYAHRPCGCYCGDSLVQYDEMTEPTLQRAWAKATNQVQWQPTR